MTAAAKGDDAGDRAGLGTLWQRLRPHGRALVLALVLAFAGAGAALAQPLLVREVIAGIEASEPVGGLAVLLAVALVVAVLVVAVLVVAVQRHVLQRTGEALVLSTRTELVRRLPRLPPGARCRPGWVLLSGGQRQRLTIARALLARPAVLLLDEGRVVATGTHDELVDGSPLYRDLAGRQLLV